MYSGRACVVPVVLLGYGAPTGSAASGSATDASESATEDMSSEDTSTGSDDTETGEMCTGETCISSLQLDFGHSLPLLDGPHRVYIDTPLSELTCSVEAVAEGDKSCFGIAFADLSWTPDLITVFLTNPFFDAVENPEALPFEEVNVRVERGQELLYELQVPLEGGEVIRPDPCGPECWHAVGSVTFE